MRLFEQISPLRTYVRGMRMGESPKSIGFVPTMGALHDGHLGLIRKAKADCDVVVVSIFVNPMQFGVTEDLSAYPRPLIKDQQLCSNESVDALLLPSVEEMYPDGFDTSVLVPRLATVLEGAHRPGHFAGVATVVLKLLNIVQPDRMYLGQKDFQQVRVLDRMVKDLNLQTSVISVKTVRDSGGLALSSRNYYLSEEERIAALVLNRTLQFASDRICSGETNAALLHKDMLAQIALEPLAHVDYVALVDPTTLTPIESLETSVTLAALAVRIGTTRLIDNMLIAPPGVPLGQMRTLNT